MKYKQLLTLMEQGFQKINTWENQWPQFNNEKIPTIPDSIASETIAKLCQKLKNNYPFFHPTYAGQMLKPPHEIAMAAYATTMLINPNNHALDGGPATAEMEKECIQQLATCFGFDTPLGHLTSSGTIANLEALWISKQLHPNKTIAYSEQSHYTHERMCNVIQVDSVSIKSLPNGKMDTKDLEKKLQEYQIGTVVVTLGTTSLGALDPLKDILVLQKVYGFRIHVDMAYGGFYAVLADTEDAFSVYKYLNLCDSIVIDPHKHGLQPYGCGCVLFNDPSVGQLYKHNSPYTYFTSDELHLGEISLECSRAGAAAAAFWATLQCFPLEPNVGFGPILKNTRQAALELANELRASERYALYLEPELDIVTYFPKENSTEAISRLSEHIFKQAMTSQERPLYLATLKVKSEQFGQTFPDIQVNSDTITILRSCLLKAEHLEWVPELCKSLDYHHQNSLSAVS